MGIVHAKEQSLNAQYKKQFPKHHINYEECEETKHLELLVPARVDRIHIEGVSRTKNDFIENALRDIFTATTFQEVLLKSHQARMRLDNLSLFRNVTVFIDVSKGPGSTPDGLEVTFHVREMKRVIGGVTTEIGNNNEGSLVVGLKAPNIFGRGERIQTEYSYGSRKTNNFNVTFIKPFLGKHKPALTASIYQNMSEWPWSGYKQLDRGLSLGIAFESRSPFQHNLIYDACIREIGVYNKNSSFEVRENSGSVLKSAVKHILTVDKRDEAIFPTCGWLAQLNTEVAGLGGNIGFFKNDAYLQANYSIAEDFVLQGTLAGGVIKKINDDLEVNIGDMFYLGGPLSLRGFRMRGAGPSSGGDAAGALAFFSGGLHLYTPLPFRPGRSGFGELFRTHLFVNFGGVLDDEAKDDELKEVIKKNTRVATGIGIALRLGQMARVEVNYCFPIKFVDGDRTQPGVQFGVGVQFI